MSTIVIVEDDENIRRLISYTLEGSGFACQSFGDGAAMFEALRAESEVSLFLLDIMLPEMSGTEILKRLRMHALYRDTPVMMLTAKSAELDKVTALDMGADDYMTKPFGVMELISRVRALLRRSSQTAAVEESPDKELRFLSLVLQEGRHRVCLEGPEGQQKLELSLKEYELLHLLMLNQGLVLSRDVIMTRIWGYEYEGESRTIDMHIKQLRQKLGELGGYIRTVRGVGYVLSEEA